MEEEDVIHIAIFNGKRIRRKLLGNKWFFSVVDIIEVLTDSEDPNDYWYRLKKRERESSGTELSTFCRHLFSSNYFIQVLYIPYNKIRFFL